MADNITVPVSVGTADLATDDKGGVHWQRVQITGEQPVTTTGSLTTATSTVAADVTNMGNATITLSGTHAGFTIVFEASDDGGTTYYQLQGQRESDGTVVAGDSPVTNSAVMYLIDCPGITNLRVRATARTSGTINVRISPGGMVAVPVVSIGNTGGSTGTTTSVAATTGAGGAVIKAANPGRRGLTIYNETAYFMWVLLGAGTVSNTNYSVKMAPGSYYEVPYGFTGAVNAIWSSAIGSCRVTEVTA